MEVSSINSIPDTSANSNTSTQKSKDIRYKDRGGDFFDIDLEDEDTISDIFAKDYVKHSEDIGEVLKNISDIELEPKKVTAFVNRVIRENIGDIDSHTRDLLSLEIQLALESVDRNDPEEVSNAMVAIL